MQTGKNINTPIAFLLSVALVGCATPNDLRQKAPDLQLNSAKSAKDVAMCIADKWENADYAIPVSMRETSTGYTLLTYHQGNTPYMCDIKNVGSGSQTSFYYTLIASRPGEAVKDCQ